MITSRRKRNARGFARLWMLHSRSATLSCCLRFRFPRRRSARALWRSIPREEPLRPLTLRLTQLFNLTGHPAISLPCGNTGAGLPCGLQLVGKRQYTVELLKAALSCEMFVTPSHALSPSALR